MSGPPPWSFPSRTAPSPLIRTLLFPPCGPNGTSGTSDDPAGVLHRKEDVQATKAGRHLDSLLVWKSCPSAPRRARAREPAPARRYVYASLEAYTRASKAPARRSSRAPARDEGAERPQESPAPQPTPETKSPTARPRASWRSLSPFQTSNASPLMMADANPPARANRHRRIPRARSCSSPRTPALSRLPPSAAPDASARDSARKARRDAWVRQLDRPCVVASKNRPPAAAATGRCASDRRLLCRGLLYVLLHHPRPVSSRRCAWRNRLLGSVAHKQNAHGRTSRAPRAQLHRTRPRRPPPEAAARPPCLAACVRVPSASMFIPTACKEEPA